MKSNVATVGLTFVLAGKLLAAGLSEPGIVMFGRVEDSSLANAAVVSGTVTCRVLPVGGGGEVVSSAALGDLGGGTTYRVRVPFETLVGSKLLSAHALATPASPTSYQVTVAVTVGALTRVATAQVTFGPNDRAKVVELPMRADFRGLGGLPGGFRDSDGDGMGDADEMRAGTDPGDAASNLRFTHISRMPEGGVRLEWSARAGHTYKLMATDSLGAEANWRVLASGLAGQEPTAAFVDVPVANSVPRFYRLIAE